MVKKKNNGKSFSDSDDSEELSIETNVQLGFERLTTFGDLVAESTQVHPLEGHTTSITVPRSKLIEMSAMKREHVFEKDVITLGSAAGNDLIIKDDTVSRFHARIYIEKNAYMIEDLASTNGTSVNRVRVKDAWLKSECTIALGKTEYKFVAFDDELQVVPSKKDRFGYLVGQDKKMREIFTVLERVSPTDATVIIDGETGTGKEVVAKTLHEKSKRVHAPFVVFDCGAVPENLIESELFGHEKGSFTGAVGTRQGVFEMANGGTVFLDELGELQLDLQPKLLRVLEQREVRRIGGNKSIKINVRVIAATNRNLEQEVKSGRFREDLFYRLSVVRVTLPPLRSRPEDIRLLVKHFLATASYNKDLLGHQKVLHVAPSVMNRFLAYTWPGNIRELNNTLERAVNFTNGDTIEMDHVPEAITWPTTSKFSVPGNTIAQAHARQWSHDHTLGGTFKDAKEKWVASFELDYIVSLLKKNHNNISAAAREAEIDRKYFRKLMKKYGLISSDKEDNDNDDGGEA